MLDGVEAKSIYLHSKKTYCHREIYWVKRLTPKGGRIPAIIDYLKCMARGFHHYLLVYNPDLLVEAFIYNPWILVVCDDAGYKQLDEGELEKIYSKLEVEVIGRLIVIRALGW